MKRRRRLGRTDIEISPIGLGCWQFSQGRGIIGGYWDSLSAEQVRDVVQVSLNGDINWFDTAEAYGGGRSEEMLSEALQACEVKPGDVVVATKWLPIMRTASSIGSTIEERRKRLSPYPIDLHQIHQPLALSSVQAQMNEMADLVDGELIRAVGVSNFGANRMRYAHAYLAARGIALASNQMPYSLLDRRIESSGVLAAARELGITIIAYSPLAQGLLTGRFHDDPAAIEKLSGMRRRMGSFSDKNLRRTWPLIKLLREIGTAYGVEASDVALNWLVSYYGDVVVAIPGATRASQARNNAKAQTFDLTHKELERIDEASRRLM